VRAGGDTRIVRATSIPGGRHEAGTRAWAVAKLLGTLGVVVLLTVSIVGMVTVGRGYSRERDIRAASQDAGGAAAAISGLGTSIIEFVRSDPSGTMDPEATFGGVLEGRALEQVADLLRSARENHAWAYEIHRVSDVTYDTPNDLSLSAGNFVVHASERGTRWLSLQFTVRKEVRVIQRDVNSESGETTFHITDIEIGEFFDAP
jgi:hypothetical protein